MLREYASVNNIAIDKIDTEYLNNPFYLWIGGPYHGRHFGEIGPDNRVPEPQRWRTQ